MPTNKSASQTPDWEQIAAELAALMAAYPEQMQQIISNLNP